MHTHFKSRSLQRKIQNAIFRSTLFSNLLLACVFIPALLIMIIPVGQIMSRGVAIEIIQRFATPDAGKLLRNEINMSTLSKTTEEQLIARAVKESSKTATPTAEDAVFISEDFFKMPILVVDEKTTDLKRLILIATEQYQNANQIFDKPLPFLKLYTLDFQVGNYSFFLPDEKLKGDPIRKNVVEHYLTSTTASITVTNNDNIPIGTLSVGLNPNIINLIIVPYLAIMLTVSIIALIIVSVMGKFLTAGILKPMKNLNKQMRAMADGDLDKIIQTPIAIKKAPSEINQLIDSSNEILIKMTEATQLLESQNVELHAQNEELIATKQIIQKQQNMLVQNEKMASIGQLSAAIVHEINTPVGAIKSNAQMIKMLSDQMSSQDLSESQSKPLNKIKDINSIILQASERVIEIIKSLKSYSRLDQSEFKASDVNEDLKNVLLLTSNLWKNRIQINEAYGDIPLVRCYSGLLNQVFMNLIVNGIDAMEEGGVLTLTTSATDDEVLIAIRDTGTGIESEHLSHIFEEGFTTKAKNKGSGLGLALSEDIINRHHGHIEVITEVGIGSTFIVHLPLASDQT